MKTNYYFGINDQQVGPLDEETIKRHIVYGKITKGTLSWCENMKDWRPVGEIDELVETFGELLDSRTKKPPVSHEAGTSDFHAQAKNIPEGLDAIHEAAYRFIFWIYRWRTGLSRIIQDYVRNDPKRALPVSIATIFLVLIFIGALVPESEYTPVSQQFIPQQQNYSTMPQQQNFNITPQQQPLYFNQPQQGTNTMSASDILYEGYKNRQNTLDNIGRKNSNAMLGLTDVMNPDTGETGKVSNYSSYNWQGPDGIVGTETDTSPGINYTPLEEQ